MKFAAISGERYGETRFHAERLVWRYAEPTFRCDYCYNIKVGENFFANFDCVILDVCEVRIDDNCMMARVFTSTQQLIPSIRMNAILCVNTANPLTSEMMSELVVAPSSGENAVIASGTVVTKDVPANVVVDGNPARVIKEFNDLGM